MSETAGMDVLAEFGQEMIVRQHARSGRPL